jgi:FAD/FMN-containing dehydrogenase/ferredoxin
MDGSLKRRLADLLGEEARVLDGTFERELYSRDVGEVPFVDHLFETTPELVVQPKSAAALQKIVAFARTEQLALFPRGAGSSGLGGVLPTEKGLVIDLSAFHEIIALNREAETVTVQAGVRWSELEEFLRHEELALRAYPTSYFSTVGGWIATGGYGIGSFTYGHLRDQIDTLEVLFPSGEIASIHSDDERFARFFGTEGQFGIILTATLRLRKRPRKTVPHLIYFESPESALGFVAELLRADIAPYHLKYLDAAHLREKNELLGEELFAERDAVLVAFEDAAEELKFLHLSENRGIPAEKYLAHYLWHERLFPLKRRSESPTPLACELLIPLSQIGPYLQRAKRAARRYAVELEAEAHLVGKDEALLLLTYASDVRQLRSYLMQLTLIPILTRLGSTFGARPYGLGIWNAPFIADTIDWETQKRYRAYKKEVDPQNLLNPHKFFAVRPRRSRGAGLLFRPRSFKLLTRLAASISPVLATTRARTERVGEYSILEKAAYSCMRCGSCAAYCPAYLITHEEAVVPRSKLMLARKLLSGDSVTKAEAEKTFWCMQCGLCRAVCQNDLDLLTAWSELEEKLEAKFGKPEEAILQAFVTRAEASDAYWRFVDAQKV